MENAVKNNLISQKIVPPGQIESGLFKIWESLNSKSTNRASLFTLIVYAEKNERLNYIRDTVQHLIEKFPCRIIFITYEKNAKKSYLKTAISVLFQSKSQSEIACDSIDIGVGNDDIDKVRYVVLPLLVPDLPTYLFWSENISEENKLFFHLQKLSSKFILDSQRAESFLEFAKFATDHFSNEIFVDLNWLKINDLKDLITTEFASVEKAKILSNITEIQIDANQKKNLWNKEVKLQSYYLIFWLAYRLKWSFTSLQTEQNAHRFKFSSSNTTINILLNFKNIDQFECGDIFKISMKTQDKSEVRFNRCIESKGFKVDFSNTIQCDIPFNFRFAKFELGHLLANEIISVELNDDFIKTLSTLSKSLK